MTLEQAVLAHGGDAAAQQQRFAALEQKQKAELIAFLESLQLYRASAE